MSNALQRLIYLCHVKNELNRRRRRFYAIIHRRYTDKGVKLRPAKHITVAEAQIGYRKAQAEMKAMTSEMRRMRTELGLTFEWTDHGAIGGVRKWNGKLTDDVYIKQQDFKKYYDMECFEMEVFKEQS